MVHFLSDIHKHISKTLSCKISKNYRLLRDTNKTDSEKKSK